MAKTLARTPRSTTSAIHKKGTLAHPKHTEIYMKTVMIPLSGTNPAELQSVAAAAHRAVAEHPSVVGGKNARTVYVAEGQSFVPTKIFDGTIRPDSLG